MMRPEDIDVWIGLDVGKSAHHACALDRDGAVVYDKPLKQDEKAIRAMLEHVCGRGRALLVVDQPNTIGSLPLAVARDMGIRVAYLPGDAMRKAADLLPGGAKTDRRDAYVIAWAALRLPETLRDAGPDDGTLASLKLLAGRDEDLARESTRHINRLRSLLLQIHPAFERVLKGERAASDAALALLERYGGPTGMRAAGIDQVRKWAKGEKLRAGRIIDDMFKAIGEQTVATPGTATAESIVPEIARDIKTIKDRRRALAAHVEGLLEGHPLLAVLTSMPGVGVRTASNILLGIGGDITRFRSAAHLASYAVIAPSPASPAPASKASTPPGRATKRLKNALWQSAFVASVKHPASAAYYQRKKQQGKRHNAAIICLARRRCDVIYSMLKNGTLYQEPILAA